MLDTETKRRIDTARDILVGKVPDPKSQVEQITIALIYKFMDDMDAESEEFGGQRKFFAGEFARYGWAKLMRSGLGGHETLNLYAEAITKMPENPGIPLLFRDMFKNAYLPYRDPETLRAFLKIIDEFNYDHSERLGDAFEYLLSVLGSQGDAGQFRTPRHIIDFIVAIIDPKKNETVLDPACGTAGFLISSYKHILKANTDAKGHSTLTPDDKGRLAQNFKGYDISPDMVRLSLVNLYLHGFADPHIFEYDTLTSQDRWNEYLDVILANPPFMSPKGGIKPHNRFSVQSKRSEVLFVDYMAEHLTPSGRAGIIVPEGIIFQSQNAYTQLRKMLVEEYLVAVVSLPAGVFNPYSGVKTSILMLDKSLAQQSNTIAFFKVGNDGFGLGAQRREIERNDLPQVKAELHAYLHALQSRQATAELMPTLGLIVPKIKIAVNGDYNLSGERYREGNNILDESVKKGVVCLS
jgi:type I restriction enzyme M protein